MREYSYKPTFSPYTSYFKAKNRGDAIKKLLALFPDYPPKTVKTWLH